MPTCSQAKIITNLEGSDLNRGFFRLVGEDVTTTAAVASRGTLASNGDDETSQSSHSSQQPQQLQQRKQQPQIKLQPFQKRVTKKHDCVGRNRVAGQQPQQPPQQPLTQSQTHVVRFATSNRRLSIDDLPQQSQPNPRETNFQLLRLHKVPIVFGEVIMIISRLAKNTLIISYKSMNLK